MTTYFYIFGLFARRTASMVVATLLCLASSLSGQAQLPWSQRLANSVMERWPDGPPAAANKSSRPSYELGVLLRGMDVAWYESGEGAYYHYAKLLTDRYVGSGVSGDPAFGRQFLLLYRVTQDPKYSKAVDARAEQLAVSGVALEEFYLTEPFYAESSSLFREPADFRGITEQFVLKEQQVPSQEAGDAMGWYMMALVDTLEFYPSGDSGKEKLLAILGLEARTAALHRDPARGRTSECMLTYALQKGVRKEYLAPAYAQDARRLWQGVTGSLLLKENDVGPTEAGACLLAATEMEMASQANQVHGQTVVVDSWFNSQQRQNAAGQKEYFHYKWNDYSDSGFSLLGHIFASHGATLATLEQAPTAVLLRTASYYLIASPDIPIKNPQPHYVDAKDAAEIARWVHAGGVLVLMPNDPANGDIDHLNLLADKFGIHFEKTLAHHVVGDQFSPGVIPVEASGTLFHAAHTLYMKDTCTMSLTAPARALLTDKSGAVIATARYGKGTVVAVVDPWLYNEYTDHRKVLPEQDNFAAGKEFVGWLLQQSHRITTQQIIKH